MYKEKPRDLNMRKKKIREEIKAIKTSVLEDVMQNFALRLNKCIDANGGHLEHIL